MFPLFPMYKPIGTPENATIAAERLAQATGRYFDIWLPGCWFGFFFDIFTLIIYFSFPKQRKFPNCIVGFFCAVDSIHFLREIVKGGPIGWINEEFYYSPTQKACATLWLWVTWVESTQYVLALSLSLVIYMGVVKKQPITYKKNKMYAYGTLLFGILYPNLVLTQIYTCIMGAVAGVDGYRTQLNSCAPLSNAPSIMGIVQCFIVSVTLVLFIGMSLRYPYPYVEIGEKRVSYKSYPQNLHTSQHHFRKKSHWAKQISNL